MTGFLRRRQLSRRTVLRAGSVTIALPLLEAMTHRNAAAANDEPHPHAEIPRRMVAVETNMGILPQFFFPETDGHNYTLSPYLQKLANHRSQLTVFSGVSLPGVTGGHAAERCFLTGTPHPERGGFRNGVSLDQLAAEHLGNRTRFPSLVLAVTNENPTLSFTRSGAPIPAEKSPRRLFEKLFFQGKPDEIEASVQALQQGRSLLDFVGQQSHRLSRSLSPADRRRLDQYLTSVRELEQRLQSAEAWEYRPKPVVDAEPPDDITDPQAFARRTGQMFDVVRLALETDSTRLVSLFIDTTVIHNITHHGNRPEVLTELREREETQFDVLNDFLTSMTQSQEPNGSLLDRTMVLYGTCMGSANSHSNVNLPVLLAGGGFRHGQHLAFDTENNYPLSNLYVSMLQRLGIETDTFSTGTGTMRGLEFSA
ncbi:MAG: DUF1552 domain-containing protein [Planctomycetaceae bacterium]|nr:DUF1552 domain-containing protein [Planctomycetaceae bacterium]